MAQELLLAAYRGDNEKIKSLLDSGIDINIREKYTSTREYTALLMTSEYNELITGETKTIELLLERGADINCKNEKGENCIMVAYRSVPYSLDTIKLLIENEINLFAKDNANKTILSSKDNLDPNFRDHPNEYKQLVSKYIWNHLYKRDIEIARKYSKSGNVKLPKEIWKIILLNKRLESLYQSDKNKEILKFFAMELNIQITEEITKQRLYELISKQIVYGKILM